VGTELRALVFHLLLRLAVRGFGARDAAALAFELARGFERGALRHLAFGERRRAAAIGAAGVVFLGAVEAQARIEPRHGALGFAQLLLLLRHLLLERGELAPLLLCAAAERGRLLLHLARGVLAHFVG